MTNPPRKKLDKSFTLKRDKNPTLNPEHKCCICWELANVVVMDKFFYCLKCYLERLRDKLKTLDRAKNYH